VLPEALVNFLALLGWSLNDQDQIVSLQELMTHFSLERVSKSPAIFDLKKLEWMNGVYIRRLSPEELVRRAWPRLVKKGWVKPLDEGSASGLTSDPTWHRVLSIVKLEQTRLKYLAELETSVDFFFVDPAAYETGAEARVKASALVLEAVKAFRSALEDGHSFTAAALEASARKAAADRGVKFKEVAQAVRLALTGRLVSPPLFETMEILGREVCLARLDRALLAWSPGEGRN